MLAGDVDDKICTLRHVHLQFQIAAVEGIESFSVQIQHVQIGISTRYRPARSVVRIDRQLGVFLGFCKRPAAFIQQREFLVEVDQLALVQLAKTDVVILQNDIVQRADFTDYEFLAVRLEIRERIAADHDLCRTEFLLQSCADRIVRHRSDVCVSARRKSALAVRAFRIKITAQEYGKQRCYTQIVCIGIVNAQKRTAVAVRYRERVAACRFGIG